jgi:hypothetical protein
MFQIKVVEKIKTHILCSETFSENRVVYEIMSKNVAETDRHATDHNTCIIR